MKLAFWNVRKKPALVAALAEHARPDVLLIAECGDPAIAEAGLKALDKDWTLIPGTGPLIVAFERRRCLDPLDTMERGAVLRLRRPGRSDALLFPLHLWSQTNNDVEQISLRVSRLRPAILEHEQQEGHRRSIVIGDFNLEPFSLGLSSRELLMGVMDLRQAKRCARGAKTTDAVFYNPMWGHLGDRTPGPPGTYHRSGDSHRDYFFHTFDQVLIRPGFAGDFVGLEVLRTLGPMELVSRNDIPRKAVASDHLPLIVNLK